MKPEKEVRICDICDAFYSVYDNPDYKFIYLNKELDVCPNCYNRITRVIQSCKEGHREINLG